MSYSDQDVAEGRGLVVGGRVNRLAIGDKLLSVTAGAGEGVLDAYCDDICLSARTGRDYRQTARLCTPLVRKAVAASGIHVSYSVLREGARTGSGGVAVDEGYRKLRALLKETQTAGGDRVGMAQYQRVLGTAPALGDLLGASGGAGPSLAEYLGALGNHPDREKIVCGLLEKDAELRGAARRTIEDQRRVERDRNRYITCGPPTGKGAFVARDLVRLGDQTVGFMHRYPDQVELSAEQLNAVKDTLVKVELLVSWIQVRLGVSTGAGRDRAESRVPAAV
ncbi:hypothetical protein [Streptomyces sp. A5-4]|uniref:hypothetical protein n=1 Tax=Streptomyces sp. A5-4 TaxID=3384771 RepID=UPI003DA7D435